MKHLAEIDLYDLYNNIKDITKSIVYKKMLSWNEDPNTSFKIDVDKEIQFRIDTYKDIQEKGLQKVVEVYAKDGKYLIVDGGGRSSAVLYLGQKIKVKVITENKGNIGYYLNEDEVEIK